MAEMSENDVMSLFQRPAGQEGGLDAVPNASPEPEVTEPTPTVQQGPDISGLQQQVGLLTNLVGQMFQKGFQQPQQPQTPVVQQVDPFQEILKPGEFFTPEDAYMLTQGNKPIETLNKMGNQIKESVAKPLLSVIQQQQQQLQSWQQQQQEREYSARQQAAAEQADKEFFERFSDLKDMQGVVRYEAALMAEAARQNPAMLAGKTRDEAAAMLAEKVRGLRKQWAGGGSEEGEVQQQAAVSPASRRNPFMERGGPARVGATQQPKDANTKSLREMSSHLQRRKQR